MNFNWKPFANWWQVGEKSEYLGRYTIEDVPPPVDCDNYYNSQPTMWTVTTTTTQRIRPFYHPAAYSKRWKR
jgi:hypothetical protein